MSASASHGAFVVLNRDHFYDTVEHGLHYTLNEAMSKDKSYTLFKWEDRWHWLTFTVVFMFLICLDNFVLNRNPKALTMKRAVAYSLFWIACAGAFWFWIYEWKGQEPAFMWASGYMLEWMLSFDNLFVFHMIFQVYKTPDRLKQKPLFLGIIGAVIFRLVFIFVGEYLMHAMFFMHVFFGIFLVYTGVKTVFCEDEDDDTSQLPLVLWLQRKLPFVNAYDEHGSFFVRVPVNEKGELLKDYTPEEKDAEAEGSDEEGAVRYGVVDFAKDSQTVAPNTKFEKRATMLVLVVFCLEVSDLLFAIDSVSAIVAQVPDLFLAYTSAVFAMLGLRATFFIIDVMVQLFALLRYGVGVVLVFVGTKLILSKMYHIPASIVCAVLVISVGGSMLASVIKDKMEYRTGKEGLEKTTEETPLFYKAAQVA